MPKITLTEMCTILSATTFTICKASVKGEKITQKMWETAHKNMEPTENGFKSAKQVMYGLLNLCSEILGERIELIEE
jgi:hypothetical protein